MNERTMARVSADLKMTLPSFCAALEKRRALKAELLKKKLSEMQSACS
jgi:hypothetical protein